MSTQQHGYIIGNVKHLSSGDICRSLIERARELIGDAPALSLPDKQRLRAYCAEVENTFPFPAMPWIHFILEHLEYAGVLREQLDQLLEDKAALLEDLIREMRDSGARIGLEPSKRILIQGFTGIIPRVFANLPPFPMLFVAAPQTSGIPATTLDTCDAAEKIQSHAIDTFVFGAEAVGIWNKELYIIDRAYEGNLLQLAQAAGTTLVIVAGRYKMWHPDLFRRYAQRIEAGTLRNHALIRASSATWVLCEGGPFTPKECVNAYDPWLAPSGWMHLGLAMGESTVPVFFHEDSESARKAQVEWCRQELELDTNYFAEILGVEEVAFVDWLEREGSLADRAKDTIGSFWDLQLHLMSLFNADLTLLKQACVVQTPPRQGIHDVPWQGSSINAYVRKHGTIGINRVTHRLQALKSQV